ncbi:hypothetical protein ABZ863_31020 [Saccharomonospora sp. NPDC046836]|uniref:hypothetical protein n=1 Tax=Saccharomonospora sp. NPDC046836 TaxID=3156921 RepID=UPI0033FF4A91
MLTGICSLAVRYDALDENPVREIGALGKKKQKTGRLVNPKTAGAVLGLFHASEDAARWDLVDRHAESQSRWVVPFARGTLRDPDNTRKYMRRVVAGTPFEGLHPHDWCHYVAGMLDGAGLTARQIADYLGHEKVSTAQDKYMERGVVGGVDRSRARCSPDDRPAQKYGLSMGVKCVCPLVTAVTRGAVPPAGLEPAT